MSGQTQFIIVTHNRKTMEMGSVLYGVTMQEPGVSKLVSVRWKNRSVGAKAAGRRCLCSIKSHSALNVGAQHAAPLPPANEALRHPRKPHKFFLMLHCKHFFGCATWKGQSWPARLPIVVEFAAVTEQRTAMTAFGAANGPEHSGAFEPGGMRVLQPASITPEPTNSPCLRNFG